MKYIYPKLSKFEIPGIRFGGYGLGNLLFTYSRVIVYCKNFNCKMIWPTWPSIKIGPYLRREKDKRFYGDLFKNKSGYICGLKKFFLLHFCKRKLIMSGDEITMAHESVLIYDDFVMNFDGLLEYRDFIRNDIIKNLNSKNLKPLQEDFSKCISVHVRLGDFLSPNISDLAQGKNNMSLPIDWYVSVINQINTITNNQLTFNVFSDGTDEQLKKILDIKNARRLFYGTSIADIIAISRAPLIIASGSSTSLWARFLGNCSSISYLNQKKCRTISLGNGFEIELGMKDKIKPEAINIIKEVYRINE